MAKFLSGFKFDLKFKIFFFNLILLVSAISLMTYFEFVRQQDLTRKNFENKSQTLTKSLENVLYKAIAENDKATLESIAQKITSPEIGQNDIISFSIMDNQNRDIAVSHQSFPQKEKDLIFFKTAEFYFHPIKPAGISQPVGTTKTTFSTEFLSQKESQIIYENLMIGFFLAFLGLLGSMILAGILNRPLRILVEAANKITQGETAAKIEETPEDEIGILIATFNKMAETIGIHLEDLRKKNHGLERRVFELSTLHQASRVINSVLNLDQLYERIVDTTISVLGGVKSCSLMLVDKKTNEFIIKIAKGLDVGLLPTTRRVSTDKGIAGKVFISGEPILLNDFSRESDTKLLEATPVVRSSLCVPIKNTEEVIGIISAGNKVSGEPFSPNDLLLLETLAVQSGIAIKNAKLYQDLRRRMVELNTLHEVGKSLSIILDIEKLLELVLDQTTRVLGGVRFSSLILYDDESGLLQVKVSKGINRDLAKKPIKIGEGIAGKVFERGEPIVINNMATEGMAFQDSNFVSKSSLCVPLKIKEQTIGVLSVSDKLSGESFDDNDLHMLVTLASQIAITVNNAKLYEDLEASYLAAVRALANSLDAKDPYTAGHSERVAIFSLEIGKKMTLPPADLKNLKIGALLHDIGKIGISEAIINKATRLTEDEYELVKTHPVRGAAIIEPAKFLKEKVPLIKFHHERYDGKGYPDGLKSENIPLLARIVCVADSYDAMTSKRAYRDTLDKETAIQELVKCSGTQFDPKIVAAFLEVLNDGKYLEEIEKLADK